MATESRKYDTRTIERFIREGKISDEEYEKYLASLPDAADKAETLEAEFVHGVLEDGKKAPQDDE